MLRLLAPEQNPLQQLHSHPNAFVRRRQRVFVFDADYAIVTGHSQRTQSLAPLLFAVAEADRAEVPRAFVKAQLALRIQHPVGVHVVLVQRDILRVHMEDRLPERRSR